MFLLRINSVSFNTIVTRTYKNSRQCFLNARQLQTLSVSLNNDNIFATKREFQKPGSQLNITSLSENFQNRNFCTEPLPKDPNVFGDIGTRQYDQTELDEVEQKIEEFEENEAKPYRRYRKTPGQYADLIKSHLENGDLASAENVLEIIKENRDKPTLHMYNLIIRGYALQGNVKKCFKLYNDFKKRGMKPNDATITSLFNVCSNSLDNFKSLEALHNLRSYLYDNQYTLNATHYNTLVKAYARHRHIKEAFQVLDKMRDERLKLDDITFNSLLHGATSLKENGIKYALTVWHLMKFQNVKPSVTTYNLLFRAIRDTELGDLKVNDVLLAESKHGQIVITDGGRPDLLATPPIVRFVPLIESQSEMKKRRRNNQRTDEISVENEEIPQQSLNQIIKNNRLILFGGFDGLMQRMEDDGVRPDVKSLSLCLELVPNTKDAEKHVIRYARHKRIRLDTGFYNILIKRRCFRYDYEDAKDVLAELEKDGCQPDIITWGVIALSCQSPEEGKSLLQCLDSIGITPNYFIYGALFRYATGNLNIEYVIELMRSMEEQEIVPSKMIYDLLDKFKESAAQALEEKKPVIKDLERFQIELTKFKLRYSKFQKKMKRNNIMRSSED